ncbi:MAG: beta-lactamase family protein [Bacteroidia bacterium]|nr:beta-lactamase family protein [Bacteroidia bacterium]
MRFLKWVLIISIFICLGIEIFIWVTGKTYLNTLLPKTILSGKLGPDIDELSDFKTNTITNEAPQTWTHAADFINKNIADTTLQKLEDYQTAAFLVIKEDSILYERYWDNYDTTTQTNSFSMSKSIVSILIGCAITDGLIKNVDEPACNYLEDFESSDLKKITIRHLLTMSSGLGFKEDYSSMFSWPAEAYYGQDVNKLTIEQAKPITKPGVIWKYKGGDTQLLGMILKKVTQTSVSEYASERLWKPIGAEYPAYWSLDENGMEKVSCCWYATAHDFARIAKLILNYGRWNEKIILDSSYIVEAIKPAELVTEDGVITRQYGFQWWLMQYNNSPVYYARGIKGQYIFAIPEKNMIVVRLGHKRAKTEGGSLPADIFLYLDAAFSLL